MSDIERGLWIISVTLFLLSIADSLSIRESDPRKRRLALAEMEKEKREIMGDDAYERYDTVQSFVGVGSFLIIVCLILYQGLGLIFGFTKGG